MNLQPLNTLVATGFAWTWKTSLQATVLIALVGLLLPACKRLLAPRWHYALGLLILLRLALPVAPSSSFSIFNLGTFFVPSPSVPAASVSHAAIVPIVVSPDHEKSAVNVAKTVPIPFLAYMWLAGFVAMLALVARQQRKFTLHLRSENVLTDPRMLALLEECKRTLHIKHPVRLLATPALNTPALFGIWRPRLLIPESILERLNHQELRLIFLHELTHLKNGDLIVNWVVIILRAVHWFNPLVWLALRRLRADQELACDVAVIRRLAAPDRHLYGDTLLKLIAGFSSTPLGPVVVPFITNKQLIKRRITMIATFKPAGRIAAIGSLTLLIALCGATFTKARLAEPTEPQATVTASPGTTTEKAGIQTFDEEAMKLDRQVQAKENEVEKLRIRLKIPLEQAKEGKAPAEESELIHHFYSIKTTSEMECVKNEKLLSQLRELSPAELRQVLPTAAPDAILNTLMQDLNSTQAQLATLKQDFGSQHPKVLNALKLAERLDREIDQRTQGIMKGLAVRVAASKSVVENADQKIKEIKTGRAKRGQWDAYFNAKEKLELLRKERDIAELRAFQKHMESVGPQTDIKGPK